MDLRPIFFVIGVLLSILSLSMILPMLADFYFGEEDWKVFFVCIVITAFFGGSLILSNAGQKFDMNLRQAFLLTTMSWLVLVIFAALPFSLSELDMTFTDAFFEAMSGLTTTGATVINGLDVVCSSSVQNRLKTKKPLPEPHNLPAQSHYSTSR